MPSSKLPTVFARMTKKMQEDRTSSNPKRKQLRASLRASLSRLLTDLKKPKLTTFMKDQKRKLNRTPPRFVVKTCSTFIKKKSP